MSTITTRSGKGSPLTNNEVDTNFTNLNTDKLESADLAGYAELTGATFTGEVEATGFNGDLTGAILFKGQAGEALTKGDPVYISGISGNKTVVSKADANDANKMPCFGIVDATVSANADCSVVTFGTLQGLDTSSFSEGDELFVSDTGTLTTTAPTGESSQIQKIGKVTRSHASAGSIKVMGAGRTNAVPNLNDGQFFLGNGSNQAVSTDFTTSVLGEISAGTGIGISGSGVISNSAPDQTVSLTGGTGISTSGTYPNFTITNDSPDQTVSLTGAGTTTVSGTYPNFTITGAGTTYTAGTGLSLTGTEFANTAPDQTVTLTGAGTTTVSGTYPNFTITGAGTTYTASNGITLSGTDFQLTDTNAKLNLTGGTITSGGNIGLKVSHDDFQEGIISYRNHANYSPSYVFENASGRTGTLYTQNNFPMWRDGTTTNSHKVWTQGNDGSGSGLDADTVDGIQASSFLRSDATDTMAGGLRVTGGSYSSGIDTATIGVGIDKGEFIYSDDGNYLRIIAGHNTAGKIQIGQSGTSLITGIDLYSGTSGNNTLTLNGNKIWNAGNDGSGSGLDADTVDGVHASSFNRFYNNSYLNSSTTTANLIAELSNDYGAFNNNSVTLKNAWSYAGNSNLVTGHPTLGTIELAGCIVEAWGGTYKHIRITRPTTGTGGQKIAIYNDQGSSYSPGWREVWNSETAGIVPSGGIIMWSGSTSSIPSGYVLCNGSNGTPDLRNRFVVGAGSSYSVGNTGGASSVTLSTSNLPSHTHSFSATTSTKSLTGSFQFTDNNSTSMKVRAKTASGIASTSYSGSASHVNSSGVPGSANLPNAINLNASHNHTLSGTTGGSGSGSSHENRPPYYALAYIMKT